MAPERSPRPGGIGLPGMRNSALATAALTSVALLSQTAGATPAAAEDGPSRDEVRQRIDNLYDRAETDTGTFNATRAATSPRKRAGSLADTGRGQSGTAADAGTGNTPRRQADPALGDVTRQWFDVARAKLGPTTPASLPPDRRPASSVDTRPARPAAAPGVREQAAADRPVAELTARSVPALPPAPETAPKALPAATAESGPSSLRTTKERVQRQLAAARDLLTAHAAQTALTSAPLAAIESRPAEDSWATPAQDTRHEPDLFWQQQQPTAATMGGQLTIEPPPVMDAPLTTNAPLTMDTRLTTNAPLPTDALFTTNAPFTMDASLTTNAPLPTDTPFTTDASLLMDASPTMTAPVPTDAPAAAQAPFAAPAPAPFPTATPLQADGTFTPGLPLAGAAPVGVTPTPEPPAYETKATRALAFARAQVGKPCVWGAAGPGSYDNAGLTQAAWRAAGVELPRTTPAQASSGTAVALADTRIGDLVFFYDDLSHVGLYIGNGTMIHAPGPGAYIREESVFYAGESAIRGAVRPA